MRKTMVGGLIGRVRDRAFSSKCKKALKRTRYRIQLIQKRKNTIIGYLKNDIAQLLEVGFDTNAYSRTDGLTKEMKVQFCYKLIDQFCGCILEELPIMAKQRECPPQNEEAVATLIYASSRFADLPELRDLRHRFKVRYGDTMESLVNKEFIEKALRKPPTMDQKLKLLQDISEELSIKWDPKVLSEKLENTNLEHVEPKEPELPHIDDNASPTGESDPELSAWSDTETESEETDSPTASHTQHQMSLLDHDSTSETRPDSTTTDLPQPPYLKSRFKEHASYYEAQATDSSPEHHLMPIVGSGVHEGLDQNIHARQEVEIQYGDEKANTPVHEKPKPRSVRRNLTRRIQETEGSAETPMSPK